MEEDEKTYEVVRYFAPGVDHRRADKQDFVVKRGLTLEEAKWHCTDPGLREEGVYFDGFREEAE